MRDLTTAIMHIARSIGMPITHEGAEQHARLWCPRCDREVHTQQAWKRGRNVGRYRAQYLEPLRTQTTAYTRGLLVPSGGTWHEDAYPANRAMRTVTTRENHGLLVPYYSASETAKPTTHPVGTLTTVDRYALVTLRGTNAPKPVTHPLDTVTASGNHHGLMDVTEDDVMACRFRMLEPHEIAAGMSFPRDYRWLGTKRERVRLAGNAVTPPAARDLVTVVAESITGEPMERAA